MSVTRSDTRNDHITSAYDEKKPSMDADVSRAEQASVALKPDGFVANSYDVDPFAINEAQNSEDYLEFRTMGWVSAGVVGTAEGIALGLLSYPSVFMRLGMVGGVIATIGLAVLGYLTCWIMVDFKLKHMGVLNYGDAMGVVFGPWGKKIIGTAVVIKSMGLAGSHVLVGQKALNTLSDNAICGVWYGLIVAVASIFMSYNREWGKLHFLSGLSVICILAAAMITMVGVGVQSENVLTKGRAPIEFHAFPPNPTLIDIIGGLTNIVFSYGGSLACLSLCSEMKKPNDFKKSFVMVQGSQALTYVIVGAVVYAFGGQYTVSPALTMTTHTVAIIAYAFALVTIMISGILGANIGTKYLYMNLLRNSPLLTSRGTKAWLAWMAMTTFMWVVGFIVSQLIPFFNELLTVISSLFSVWFIYGYTGFMFFHDVHPSFAKWAGDNEPRNLKGPMKKVLFAAAVLAIVLSVAITPLGLYSAAEGIKKGYSKGTYNHPFHC